MEFNREKGEKGKKRKGKLQIRVLLEFQKNEILRRKFLSGGKEGDRLGQLPLAV